MDRRSLIRLLPLIRPRGGFEGGLFLPRAYALALQGPIVEVPAPERLRVPLARCGTCEAVQIVRPGELVRTGQCIARPEKAPGLSIHAPVNARVIGITRVDTAFSTDIAAVELAQSRAAPEAVEVPAQASSRAEAADAEALAVIADEAGITDFGRSPRALSEWLRRASKIRMRDIIINGMSAEPVLTAERRALLDHLHGVVSMASQLRTHLHARRVWLAVDKDDRDLVRRCRRATATTPVRLIALAPRYPQSAPVLLTKTITKREVLPGASTLEAGVLVIDARAVAALSEAAAGSMPLLRNLIAVTGPGAVRPGYYRVPVGISYADLLVRVGTVPTLARVVDGGLMTGIAVESLDAVMTEQTRAIVLLDRGSDHIASPGPCIRCGFCQEDCPVGLDPRELLRLFELQPDAAAAAHPEACLECGICSFICPAELPLTQAARALRRQSLKERSERDASRRRAE